MEITEALDWWLTQPESAIREKYSDNLWHVKDKPDECFLYFDNGGSVLAVAHLDTVQKPVYSGWCEDFIVATSLDDRLGAWMIMEVLRNQYNLPVDVLLTTNEERGKSTAANLNIEDCYRPYNWAFSFDRRGSDVVTYKYRDEEAWKAAIAAIEPKREQSYGSYSCINSLKLNVCGMNIGCGYYDNHGPEAYAKTPEVQSALDWFKLFFATNQSTRFEFDEAKAATRYQSYSTSSHSNRGGYWDGNVWQNYFGGIYRSHDPINPNLHPSEYKGKDRHLGCSKRHQKRIARWRVANNLCQRCGYPPLRQWPDFDDRGWCSLCVREEAKASNDRPRSSRSCATCNADISPGAAVAIWLKGLWYCNECYSASKSVDLTRCYLCQEQPVTHIAQPDGYRLCGNCAVASDVPIRQLPAPIQPMPVYKGKTSRWPCTCGATNYSKRSAIQWLCSECGGDFKFCEKRH